MCPLSTARPTCQPPSGWPKSLSYKIALRYPPLDVAPNLQAFFARSERDFPSTGIIIPKGIDKFDNFRGDSFKRVSSCNLLRGMIKQHRNS
ncbi:protein of unknown function [uncultured Sphingopyxis sp.]|uniref:Uncharacterized protein n=1 Tax=uncultured Sphingopyxis sp. TaxID=310581 RepID=A0A1Y5PR96_9SPHN|nr:protein of unknown function [uncultured Sphingopyxis sp.]